MQTELLEVLLASLICLFKLRLGARSIYQRYLPNRNITGILFMSGLRTDQSIIDFEFMRSLSQVMFDAIQSFVSMRQV